MPYGRRRHAYTNRYATRRIRTEWLTISQALTVNSLTATNVDLLGDLEAAGASKVGVTVIRALVSLGLTYAASGDQYDVGLGVMRVSDVGASITGASFDPGLHPDLPWAWNDQYFATASGAAIDVRRAISIDMRTRRRIHGLQDTFGLSVRNVTGASLTNGSLYARVLVRLP